MVSIVSKDSLLNSNWGNIKNVLKSEGLILDDWSSSFMSILDRDIDGYQNLRDKLIYKHKSGVNSVSNDISDIKLLNPSNILINMISNTSAIDIYLCDRIVGVDVVEIKDQDESKFISDRIDSRIDILCKLINVKQRGYKIDTILNGYI